MIRAASKKIKEKKQNIFIEDINNIIGVNKCLTHGSFIKYGLEKACDIDCHESLNTNITLFKQYINKIANNKKILFVTSDFRISYEIFEIIYNNLGHTDGLFNIYYLNNNTEIIKENINKIPDKDVRKNIEKLFNDFINNKTLQNFINIKSYIRKLLYPKWTMEELLKGEKQYFDKLYTLEDGLKSERFSIDIIYLEDPYKFMSISNNINFRKETVDINKKPFTTIITNNQINYYNVCKKLMNIIKKIYFTINFKNYKLRKYLVRKYDDIYNFKNIYGNLNHNICITKNKILIYKDNKELLKKYETEYNNDFNKLNNIFKNKYYYWIRGIEPYLKENVLYY